MTTGSNSGSARGKKMLSALPELAAQWHPTKNGDLTPDTISAGSRQKVWWLGECGHEWDAILLNRVSGNGCPICSGRRVLQGYNDLVTVSPGVAREWHPTKNGDVTPVDVAATTSKRFWWQCEQGHEWQNSVDARVQGAGCAYCKGKKVLAGFNDLLSQAPEIAKQWHPKKNRKLSPDQVHVGAHRKVWWQCNEGHEWQATVKSRARMRLGCPHCSNKIITAGVNDLATLKPEIAALWHPTKNEDLTPQKVSVVSGQKVWWQCDVVDEHEWKTVISSVSGGSRCPYCANVKVDPKRNSLAALKPEIAALWHPTKNGELSPYDVISKSNRVVWWLGKCGHEWDMSVSLHDISTGCPFCASRRLLPGFNDLVTTHPYLKEEWNSDRNEKKPNEVFAGSNAHYWWKCKAGHEWQATVGSRAYGRGCPYCSNRAVQVGFNDLATTHPDIAAQWHPDLNGTLSPQDVTYGSNKMAWWLCNKGHYWECSVTGRQNSGCPYCSRRTSGVENALANYLTELLPGIEIIRSSRAVIHPYELDIYVPSKKVAIEFNGLYWHTENRGKDKDYHRNKWQLCHDQGVQLIQVWEDDWRDRQEIIKKALAHKLGISQEEKIPARKTVAAVISLSDAKAFLNKHHIQGFVAGSYYLGLRVKSSDEIVAVMVLMKQEEDLVLSRFATSVIVPGGQSKLVKYAERSYQYRSLITFADLEVSDGGLYETTGFVVDKVISPDYKYVYGGERQHKFGFRLERFRRDDALLYEEGLSERELAELNGIPRVWDSGKIRYVKPHPEYKK